MGYIEVYEGVLRYEKFVYPTIPNFIYPQIAFFYFTISDCVFYTISTPFLMYADMSIRLLSMGVHRNKHNTLAYSIAYYFEVFNR